MKNKINKKVLLEILTDISSESDAGFNQDLALIMSKILTDCFNDDKDNYVYIEDVNKVLDSFDPKYFTELQVIIENIKENISDEIKTQNDPSKWGLLEFWNSASESYKLKYGNWDDLALDDKMAIFEGFVKEKGYEKYLGKMLISKA